MEFKETTIQGLYEINFSKYEDVRGFLVKIFQNDLFGEQKVHPKFVEQYYSISSYGVLRGLHFQSPPYDHAKLIYCLKGEIQDVAVDLRAVSPTYRQALSFEISADRCNGVYIPSGFAHGFLSVCSEAIVICNSTSIYSPQSEGGIHWESVNVNWKLRNPILSEKDQNLPRLSDFSSPFTLKEDEQHD